MITEKDNVKVAGIILVMAVMAIPFQFILLLWIYESIYADDKRGLSPSNPGQIYSYGRDWTATVSAGLQRCGAEVAVEEVPSIVGAEVAENAKNIATTTKQATERRLRHCVNDARWTLGDEALIQGLLRGGAGELNCGDRHERWLQHDLRDGLARKIQTGLVSVIVRVFIFAVFYVPVSPLK